MNTWNFRPVRASLWVALIWLGLGASLAQACSCVFPGTPQEELARSDAVFRGTVLHVSEPALYNRIVAFRVSRVWKGHAEVLKTILTPDNSGLCGYPFETGKEYVVYAYAPATVYLCSRTAPLASASADLTSLGAGVTPGAASIERLVRHTYVAGSWYNPQRSGEGLQVEMLPDGRAAVSWFGYRPEDPGRQSWLVGVGTFQGMTLRIPDMQQPVGGGFGPSFDPAAVNRVAWGEVRMVFHYDDTASLHWTSVLPGYGSGQFSLQRLTRPPLVTASQPR